MVLGQPRGPCGSSLLRMSAQAVRSSLARMYWEGRPASTCPLEPALAAGCAPAGSQGLCCGRSFGAGFLGVKGLGSWQGLSDAGGQRGAGWTHLGPCVPGGGRGPGRAGGRWSWQVFLAAGWRRGWGPGLEGSEETDFRALPQVLPSETSRRWWGGGWGQTCLPGLIHPPLPSHCAGVGPPTRR